MTSGVRVFCSVFILRAVATKRRVALLASAKVHPLRSDFHALLADVLLWLFDIGDRVDVWADTRWPFVSFVRGTIG